MSDSESAERLEDLWSGEFGDEYVDRNIGAPEGREEFWIKQLETLGARSVLEVGCNVGGNLIPIASVVGGENVAGIDVNEKALEEICERVPGIDARRAVARDLPFEDGAFDLTFTMGVLIHQPPDELDAVMREIVRCSGRYVLCGEYYAEELTEVPYRGHEGALFKLDFGGRYRELFPDLKLLEHRLSPEVGGRLGRRHLLGFREARSLKRHEGFKALPDVRAVSSHHQIVPTVRQTIRFGIACDLPSILDREVVDRWPIQNIWTQEDVKGCSADHRQAAERARHQFSEAIDPGHDEERGVGECECVLLVGQKRRVA